MLWNDAIAHGRKLGLLYACLFRGILGIGANRFEVALAVVPPLDEVAPFGMKFVLSANSDSIATNTALRIKKGGGRAAFLPPTLTCLRRITWGVFGILANPWKNR